ncbi:MAG: site-2 protease family protein [Patescibacteria group bacterium]|nr:site-2 protease family protein [Patescibacteria group bacterium]
MEINFLFTIIILIMSVVIHEVSHGYSAYLMGDHTAKNAGRLTLNPLAHLDFMGSVLVPLLAYFSAGFMFGWAKPVPYNPYNLKNQKHGDAIVALSGPASNLFIALIFGLMIRFDLFVNIVNLTGAIQLVVVINLILAIFNLIPIPPLDGSKILFSFLPYKYIELRQNLERYSLFLMILVIFFLWKLLLPLVAFLFTSITGMGLI